MAFNFFPRQGRRPHPLPEKDNELSLPLGDGVQKQIVQELKDRGGKVFRNSTAITTTKARKNVVSVWDDYDEE